ncbi:MAG: hypothetical protein HUJ68_05010 [Clostridia bacterium]|nr:hypothetical protein [Clostridia bacterium]
MAIREEQDDKIINAGGYVGNSSGKIKIINCGYGTNVSDLERYEGKSEYDKYQDGEILSSAGGSSHITNIVCMQNYGCMIGFKDSGECEITNCVGNEYNYTEGSSIEYVGGAIGKITSSAQITKFRNLSVFSLDSYVGGVIGIISNAPNVNITDCENARYKIKDSEAIIKGTYVGGIVGYCEKSNLYINNCSNRMQIEGLEAVGGIVGSAFEIYGGSIKNCYNTTKLKSNSYSGGIIGQLSNLDIINCYNHGNIEGDNAPAGGIFGSTSGSENNIIQYCYNHGNIKNDNNPVGGISGSLGQKKVNDCFNDGNIESNIAPAGGISGIGAFEISDSVNYGSISSTGPLGGIVGSSGRGTLTRCYNRADVKGGLPVGGIIGVGNNGTVTTNVIACENSGYISSEDTSGNSILYIREIMGTGSVDSSCKYLISSNNAIGGGATGVENEELLTTCDLNWFVSKVNSLIDSSLKTWKIDDNRCSTIF